MLAIVSLTKVLAMNAAAQKENFLFRLLLLPGTVTCNLLGLSQEESRDLVRMLINSLVWIFAGIALAAIIS
jgi:hypothetical protein